MVDGLFTKGASVVDANFEAYMENTLCGRWIIYKQRKCGRCNFSSKYGLKNKQQIYERMMIASHLSQQLDRAVQEVVVIERPKHNETILHVVLVSYINTKCCNTRSNMSMCALSIA